MKQLEAATTAAPKVDLGHHSQKLNFKANWICLGPLACPPTVPNPGLSTLKSGVAKRTRLKTLNISARNSTFICSLIVVRFIMLKSSFNSAKSRALGSTDGAFPKVYGAGAAKALMLR